MPLSTLPVFFCWNPVNKRLYFWDSTKITSHAGQRPWWCCWRQSQCVGICERKAIKACFGQLRHVSERHKRGCFCWNWPWGNPPVISQRKLQHKICSMYFNNLNVIYNDILNSLPYHSVLSSRHQVSESSHQYEIFCCIFSQIVLV